MLDTLLLNRLLIFNNLDFFLQHFISAGVIHGLVIFFGRLFHCLVWKCIIMSLREFRDKIIVQSFWINIIVCWYTSVAVVRSKPVDCFEDFKEIVIILLTIGSFS